MSVQESQAEVVSRSDSVSVGRQALRRMVNTHMYCANDASVSDTIEIFCECERRVCVDRVRVDVSTYGQVLDATGHRVITTRHDEDGRQRLVSRHHGYLVVASVRQ